MTNYELSNDDFLARQKLIAILKEVAPEINVINAIAENNFLHSSEIKKKTRLLVKKGIDNVSIKMEDIVLVYTTNRIVFVVDKTGKKFLIDKTMNDLELELDHSIFFRANRQYIINLNFIKSFKPYEKVKLQVELTIPEVNHTILISQHSAPDFRNWIQSS